MKVRYREIIGDHELTLVEYDHEPAIVRACVRNLKFEEFGTVCITERQGCIVKLNSREPEKTIKWAVARIRKHMPLSSPPPKDDQCPNCHETKVPLMLDCPRCKNSYEKE